MASYNLNEVLKKKSAPAADQTQSEIHLDDVSRVKVLSPARQVFKRFIRNRLAVFGTCTLIVMFLFSFVGPLFYAYGQKDIFYKYASQNVNYALAKENSAYTGYTVDGDAKVNTNAANMANTAIKKMQADGETRSTFMGDDGMIYAYDYIADNVYSLHQAQAEKICSFGSGATLIGTLDSVGKRVSYEADDLGDDFVKTAVKACKGKNGTFEFGGVTYAYQMAKAKKYEITASTEGFIYEGEAMTPEFEAAAEAAGGNAFDFEGNTYLPVITGEGGTVYRAVDSKIVRVYTRCALDTYDVSQQASDEFRVQALLHAADGSFTADGADYTIQPEDGLLVIRDADGNEYAEFTTFVMRRYNGDDTMEYGLKTALYECIKGMNEAGLHNGAFTYALPAQNDAGEYAYDTDGNLQYNDTELRITQKDTGEYVVNCDQIIYVIDMYASPSAAHILGTDGDGFDVFARIMYGGRISLMVGFVVVFLESLLGIIMGGLAGFYGKWVDNLIMRLVDIFYCLPSTPIMIILGAMMDAMRVDTYIRLLVMMAVLGLMGWASVARLVRGQILSLREQEFMVATEATGIRVKARIFRHLVPNVMPQLIVSATMGMGSTILTESTLSYLGLGVKHPLATWGTIINSVSSASAMAHYAHIWIPVGLLICFTVIAFNFVGDGLRDAYDPKAKR